MLVVLAIIGIAAGATVLGIGAATRAPSVESEARRIAIHLQSAADESMVSDRPVAFDWSERGYAFVRWNGTGWQPGADEGSAPYRLPAGMTLEMGGAPRPAVIGIDGFTMPFSARLANSAESWRIRYDGLKANAVQDPAT